MSFHLAAMESVLNTHFGADHQWHVHRSLIDGAVTIMGVERAPRHAGSSSRPFAVHGLTMDEEMAVASMNQQQLGDWLNMRAAEIIERLRSYDVGRTRAGDRDALRAMDLVTVRLIAERYGWTREYVHKWTRREGFPAPALGRDDDAAAMSGGWETYWFGAEVDEWYRQWRETM